MPLSQKTQTEHTDEAKNNLVQQFKGKVGLEKLIESYVIQVSDIEQVVFDFINNRLKIDNAIGTQLDNLGTILSSHRDGLSDVNYRIYLKSVIGLYGSYGTIGVTQAANELGGSLQNFVKILTQISNPPNGAILRILNDFPAGFVAQLEDPLGSGLDQQRLFDLMLKAKPAGVGMQLHSFVTNPFTFSSDNDPTVLQLDANLGFNSHPPAGVVQNTGGKLASIIG